MRILFIFGTGSEVRQFLHSGIISNLVNSGNHIFISSKQTVCDEIKKANTEVIELPWYSMSYPSGLLSRISKILDLSFEKKYNFKTWRYNNKEIRNNSIYNIISSFTVFRPVYYFLEFIERKLQRSNYVVSDEWVALLRKHKIDRIVVNSPRNYQAILFAAQYLKIPVLVLYHTNKDIYAQGRINFRFYKYGVWNKEMANELLYYNPFIKRNEVEIIGCSHFSYLSDYSLIMEYKEFVFKFNIDAKNDFLVLYTASGPGIIPNENKYIDDIRESLLNAGINKYKIIIRTNPMDFTDQWTDENHDDIIIVKPQWHYDPIGFFNFTKQEDLKEFSTLLRYCNVCINIPSTVTIECAIAQVPVINICYNNELNKGADILRFWNAPFYKNVLKFNAAIPVFSKNELKDILILINNGLNLKLSQKLYLQNEIGVDIKKITSVNCKFILS